MNWEQKLHILNKLCDCSLVMRKPGDWYVDSEMSIKTPQTLICDYGNGASPGLAVEDHWQRHVEKLPAEHCIWVSSRGKYYRWDVCIWDEVIPMGKKE